MQTRQGAAPLDLKCGRYRLVLMSPERVTDAWVRWVADPAIMLPLGVKPRAASKQQLAQYVMQMQAQQRAVVGIFLGQSQHVGLIEVAFQRQHLTATIEILVDVRNHGFERVAGEVLPDLLPYLARRFRIEKFTALIPETYEHALAYFAASDWSLEARLEEEMFAPGHGRHLNIMQYAWFPPGTDIKHGISAPPKVL